MRFSRMRCRIGSAKAAVLPVPVWAMPTTSRPVDCERDGLGLDGRGREVIFFLECTRDGIGEAEILKGGQKMGSFHYKGRRPAVYGQERARGVRDTRVFGASVLLAEGASQKPLNGLRTRGSQGPDDSLGHGRSYGTRTRRFQGEFLRSSPLTVKESAIRLARCGDRGNLPPQMRQNVVPEI